MMTARKVRLPEALDLFIDVSVKSGRYDNATEVVCAGLRLLQQQEKENREKFAWLKQAIAEGMVEERKTARWFSPDCGSASRIERRRHLSRPDHPPLSLTQEVHQCLGHSHLAGLIALWIELVLRLNRNLQFILAPVNILFPPESSHFHVAETRV